MQLRAEQVDSVEGAVVRELVLSWLRVRRYSVATSGLIWLGVFLSLLYWRCCNRAVVFALVWRCCIGPPCCVSAGLGRWCSSPSCIHVRSSLHSKMRHVLLCILLYIGWIAGWMAFWLAGCLGWLVYSCVIQALLLCKA